MNIDPEIAKATGALHLTYPNYNVETYQFISDAVAYTIGKLETHRHVSARELLGGIKEYAFLQYGAVAPQVLCSFGLRGARNVGEVVYLLISVKLLSASPEDSPEDFNITFPWEEEKTADTAGIVLPFIDAK
ncbi:MAG: hypothetical protein IKD44_06870 [Lentisphaeria bacterium]|nr:hypothetical protein [Lentisphaeria bacterium]